MSYTDDAVLAKLSALNETQESIVACAQWVMFHRRHADRTAQLWLQRLKDSNSNKRLNLVYLANEVAQQSKARNKNEFLTAFAPVIAEASATAYKGATNDVQGKLKRVVEVWRSRNVFELPIQEAIETRIDELDKTRSTKRAVGGSIFSSSSNTASVPKELAELVAPQQTITKLVLSTKTSLNAANQDYEKLTDPSAATPSAPVHAARLNGLLKTLANAAGAVTESINARKALIEGLEKILDTNRTNLAAEESQLALLSSRRAEIDLKKKDVEDSIMRGFAPNSNPGTPAAASPGGSHTPPAEAGRPVFEALTPPGYPNAPVVDHIPEFDLGGSNVSSGRDQAGLDLLASLSSNALPVGNFGTVQAEQDVIYGNVRPSTSGSAAKKRKLNSGDDFPDLGGGDALDGLDADVAEMLRQESGNAV